jgi:hypothetical protein
MSVAQNIREKIAYGLPEISMAAGKVSTQARQLNDAG